MIPGSYALNIGSRDMGTGRLPGSDDGAAPVAEGSAAIAGRVYGPDGQPLPGARVTLAGSGFWPPKSLQTGADGRFSWPRVPAGIYELRAARGTLASSPVEGISLNPSSRRVFGLRLIEGWTLSGQVRDAEDERPLSSARIHVANGFLGAHSRSTTTDGGGAFALDGIVDEDPVVYVEADGYVASGPLSVGADDPDLDVRLERGASLEGVVIDDRGEPLRGVAVRAFGSDARRPVDVAAVDQDSLGVTAGPVPPISSSGTRQLAIAEQATTDAQGRFALRNLRSGRFTALATQSGYAPSESETVSLRPGETHRGLRIVMYRGHELRGRVLDARGRGLTGIPVELRLPSERLPRMTVSGEDGSFAFRAVRGEVRLSALPYDLQPVSVDVGMDDGDARDVDLVLSSELVTLRGRVFDERGDGIEDALVLVTSKGAGLPIRRSTKTDRDGEFAVPALPDPPYDVSVEHAGYATGEVLDVDVEEGLEVVLATGVSVVGRVVDDWTSAPLPDAVVSMAGTTTLTTRTGRDGRFSFRQVPIAVYEVRYAHPDYESRADRVEVEPPLYVDRPQELNAVRLFPGGTVEGEVRDLYGEPVREALVSWRDEPDWDSAVSTDRDGRFVLRGVPRGEVWLTARHEDAGEARSSRPVTVRPQEVTPGAHVRLPGRVRLPE